MDLGVLDKDAVNPLLPSAGFAEPFIPVGESLMVCANTCVGMKLTLSNAWLWPRKRIFNLCRTTYASHLVQLDLWP